MATTNTDSSSKKKLGESHRIYWQQWIVNNKSSIPAVSNSSAPNSDARTGTGDVSGTLPQEERLSRRELITSSAAIRLSRNAKARDITSLIRKTLQMPALTPPDELSTSNHTQNEDCLVLVGTLYSLPREFVQFEHNIVSRADSMGIQRTGDPFHVVRTVGANEIPLDARDAMQQYLTRYLKRANQVVVTPQFSSVSMNDASLLHKTTGSSNTRTIISPKLQWYFVPAASVDDPNQIGGSGSLIPNCVELDGYCTDMEDEDSDDGHGDINDTSTAAAVERTRGTPAGEPECSDLMEFRFLNTEKDTYIGPASSNVEVEAKQEDALFRQLSACEVSEPCCRGYLLHCDPKDKHVWRRVYCVLTNDHLWFTSRIYYHKDDNNVVRYAKHRRVKLTRALLLEPTADYAPLFRTPYAFELVSEQGDAQIFRANSKQVQTRWISDITERIVQSYENSMLQNAEVVITDCCCARNKMVEESAVQPLWEQFLLSRASTQQKLKVSNTFVSVVLRWGIQVAAFHDSCRHLKKLLQEGTPSKVVPPQPNRFFGSSAVRSSSASVDTTDMIQKAWKQASCLLARANHVGLTMQPIQKVPGKLSSNVETLCMHIEYVITGCYRHGNESLSSHEQPGADSVSIRRQLTGETGLDHHDAPPPLDLFDQLLAELQHLAAVADQQKLATRRENKYKIRSSVH